MVKQIGYTVAVIKAKTILERIEDYLRLNAKRDVENIVNQLQSQNQLLLFGESHAGYPRKAQFFANLILGARQSGLIRFHASEHFNNNALTHGAEIDSYLKGQISGTGLSKEIRPFAPILDEIKASLPNFGVVFTGTPTQNNRDQRLFNHFMSSRQLHIQAGRFTTSDHGHFYLGGDHAGRVPKSGTIKTTCGHIIDAGFDVCVIRLTVDVTVGELELDWGFSMTSGEVIKVVPRGGGSVLDLLPLLRRVAGGSSFIVDLKLTKSPFTDVCVQGSSVPFTDMFDFLLHLP